MLHRLIVSLAALLLLVAAGGSWAKPGAAVALSHNVPVAVVPNQPLSTTLSILANADFERMLVEVAGYQNTEVKGLPSAEYGQVSNGTTEQFTVPVVLTASEGYIAVTVTTWDAGGNTQSRVFAVRFSDGVGKAKARSAGSGEIAMPATPMP